MPESIPSQYKSSIQYGTDLALKRVQEHKGIGQFIENGMKNAVGMWFGVLPSVMAIGTIALALANNTPIFEILGKAVFTTAKPAAGSRGIGRFKDHDRRLYGYADTVHHCFC